MKKGTVTNSKIHRLTPFFNRKKRNAEDGRILSEKKKTTPWRKITFGSAVLIAMVLPADESGVGYRIGMGLSLWLIAGLIPFSLWGVLRILKLKKPHIVHGIHILLIVVLGIAILFTNLSGQDDIAALRQKAEQGDAAAQLFLWSAYYQGKGVPQDYKESVKWGRLAAEQGNARAQLFLGGAYRQGKGVPQDYKESVKWRRLAAEQGDAAAQYTLGLCYDQGEGVPQDYKEAARWYRLAAKQGNASAQFRLGHAYAAGKGVPQDDKESVKWWRLCAERGDVNAQSLMGVAYALGKGVSRDYAQGYAWIDLAASQGQNHAAETRSLLLEEMTPAQIEEGQRLSRKYAEKFKK